MAHGKFTAIRLLQMWSKYVNIMVVVMVFQKLQSLDWSLKWFMIVTCRHAKHEIMKFPLLNHHAINWTVRLHGGKAPHILQMPVSSSHAHVLSTCEPFHFVRGAVDTYTQDSHCLTVEFRNAYQCLFVIVLIVCINVQRKQPQNLVFFHDMFWTCMNQWWKLHRNFLVSGCHLSEMGFVMQDKLIYRNGKALSLCMERKS